MIGRVDAVGASAASWGSVVEEARKRARTLGGDALLVDRWGSTMSGVGSFGETYHTKDLSFSVLRYPAKHP